MYYKTLEANFETEADSWLIGDENLEMTNYLYQLDNAVEFSDFSNYEQELFFIVPNKFKNFKV